MKKFTNMRSRFKPTKEQRTTVRAQLARLLQPAATLELLRAVVPAGFKPADVVCSVESVHPDRFVLRAQVRSNGGEERSYALKAYSDDFAQRVWTYSQTLAANLHLNQDGICLPTHFVPHENLLVFPWLDGVFLSKIVDGRKPELLRRAARLAARLHRLAIVPEQPTTAQMFVEEARARCERLRNRWPQTTRLIKPLVAALEKASTFLDDDDPAPVHGDMAAGQFLWTGDRLVLLDLDMFGYTDPAYDAGHFLAQ
ncbi:MAG TPA: phosphotransferase, partial [Verrucomicrobiae bacterium]